MPLDLHGRHHHPPPAPSVGWKCPACDANNTGPLEQGCTSCGSGKPGRVVGLDPPARPTVTRTSPPAGPHDLLADAWAAWHKTVDFGQNQQMRSLAYTAFAAGYQAALGRVMQQTDPLVTGTAESRTIIAALRLFLENVLPTATDEIASGEFLSIPQTEELIRTFERKG